jgi:glutaredoxin 3
VATIEIYTKFFCGFCVRAKQLLDGKGLSYREIGIDSDPKGREEMIRRANGRSTVPQIFIDGHHVGGCTDLLALDREGKLDELIRA